MDWLYAIGGIVAVIAVAFLLGWAHKNVKSPIVEGTIWVACILLLLIVAGKGPYLLLLLARVWNMLDHIPRWVGWIVVVLVVGWLLRYVLILFAQGLEETAIEVRQANARIQLLESSIMNKLDEIQSQLPDKD